MSYFAPAQQHKGYRQIFKIGEKTPYTGCGLLRLAAGESYSGKTAKEENVLVLLSGACDITAGAQTYTGLNRKDVFTERASAVYVPVGCDFAVTATGAAGAEIAVVSAVADKKFAPFMVGPDEVIVNHRGILNWQRDVHDIVVDNAEGKVDKIIVGETFSYPGQWSSYPSHKHDTQNIPFETKMDEIYYYKVKPAEGFGVQVMYTGDDSLREAYLIKDGDVVALPVGYHPVASAPGFRVYYLWVMAGACGRTLTPCDDPKLAWLNNIGPMIQGI